VTLNKPAASGVTDGWHIHCASVRINNPGALYRKWNESSTVRSRKESALVLTTRERYGLTHTLQIDWQMMRGRVAICIS
jgi:hypothetical protein